MNPLVRIVVPMYNCSHWITDLLDSIVVQTYSNWECILIDDGSIDNTFYVAKDYITRLDTPEDILDEDIAEQHINWSSKFTLIEHLENKHVSAARNSGLKGCTTKYVYFCDSDDVLESTLLETVVAAAEQSQSPLVQFGHYCVQGRGSQERWFKKLLPPECLYTKISTKWYYCVWNFLFRMDIIQQYNLQFDEELSQNEDEFFLLMYSWYMFKDGYSYYAISNPLYKYRYINPSSLVTVCTKQDRALYVQKLQQFMKGKEEYGGVLKRMRQIIHRLQTLPGPIVPKTILKK